MSVWAVRRTRALVLTSEVPHAAEILRCYAAVTEAQERACARLPLPDAMEALPAGVAERSIDPARLPFDRLLPVFDGFLADLVHVGPEAMVAAAARWRERGLDARREALAAAFGIDDDGADALGFHPRAFAQAVATALAVRVLPALDAAGADGPSTCRLCGAPPLVATLRDLPGALGSRSLVCGRCGSEARARRLTCAYCGESSAERLRVHAADGVAHVRVDECTTCRRYIKTVDLRRRGDAVPLVEDLATPELDLWAREQGLAKGRSNLFGL